MIGQHQPRVVIHNIQPGYQLPAAQLNRLQIPYIQCSLATSSHTYTGVIKGCLPKPIYPDDLITQISQLGEISSILVIDDDRGFVQLIERILQTVNHPARVWRAYDGAEGWRLLCQQKPDLVLLDLAMPDVSGFDILERMQQATHIPDLRVILVTATNYDRIWLGHAHNQISIYYPNSAYGARTLQGLRQLLEHLATVGTANGNS